MDGGQQPPNADNGTIENFLRVLLPSVEGLRAIVISDCDGAAIVHCVPQYGNNETAQATTEDPRVYRALTAVFSVGAEQANKIAALGKMNHIMSFYKHGMILQVNCHPIVITFHASLSTNAGEILELVPSVKQAVEPIRLAVVNCLEQQQHMGVSTSHLSQFVVPPIP